MGNTNANVDVNITKVLITLGAGLAVVGMGLYVWKKVKDSIENIGDRAEGKDVVNEAEKSVNTNNLTYDNLWYESAGDKIWAALERAGTDVDAVRSVMEQLKTIDDVKRVISTFNVKKGKSGLFDTRIGNLQQWLIWEMQDKHIEKYVNEPLQNNGISYRF